MNALTEARHAGEFLLSEAAGNRSRENVTFAANQDIPAGGVIALLAQAGGVTTSGAAVAGNTGNGVLTLANPAVNSKAKNGTYKLTCIEEGSNAGKFQVEDPTGVVIGTATVGAAFNKEIKFTIADGATDFKTGDAFEIKVGVENPGDLQAVAYDPDATDGSEKAAGFSIYPVKTGSDTVKKPALVRDAEVNGKLIGWPDEISDVNKAAATADLAAAGLIIR